MCVRVTNCYMEHIFTSVCGCMHFDKTRGCLFTPHCLDRLPDNIINCCVWAMGASRSELSLRKEGGRCCRWRRRPFITSTSITVITSLPQHTGRGRDTETPSQLHSSTTRDIKTLTYFPFGAAIKLEGRDQTEVEETWASNPCDVMWPKQVRDTN